MAYSSKGFIGRKDDINAIDAVLENSNTVLIYGMGGEGKTSLVKYYAHTNENAYNRILYLSCGDGIKKAIALDVTVRNFQYDDNDGYRYVVFDFWKIFGYRVRISKVPKDMERDLSSGYAEMAS